MKRAPTGTLFSPRPRQSVLAVVIIFTCALALGQNKPPLTIADLESPRWTQDSVRDVHLSADGKYAVYMAGARLVVQSVDGSFKQEYQGCSNLKIAPDGDSFLVIRDHSVEAYDFREKSFGKLGNSDEFSISSFDDDPMLAYVRSDDKALLLRRLKNSQETSFPACSMFQFSPLGKALYYIEDGGHEQKLHWIDTANMSDRLICQTTGRFSDVAFDTAEDELVCLDKRKVGDKLLADLVVYKYSGKLVRVEDEGSMVSGLHITGQIRPTFDGGIVLFDTKPSLDAPRKEADLPQLDIWNYKDEELYFTQVHGSRMIRQGYTKALNLSTGQIIDIGEYGEDIKICSDASCNWGITRPAQSPDIVSSNYQLDQADILYVVNLLSGKQRKILDKKQPEIFFYSTNGRRLLFFDPRQGCYFSYNIYDGRTLRLTPSGREDFLVPHSVRASGTADMGNPIGLAGWTHGGDCAIVYSKTDVWELDLSGNVSPRCLTKGFGASNHLTLRLLGGSGLLRQPPYQDLTHQVLYLVGQNFQTEDQGIYSFDLSGLRMPSRIISGPYLFFGGIYGSKLGAQLGTLNEGFTKAKNANVFAAIGTTTKSGPNIYWSGEAGDAKPLTNYQPFADFNWMTSELFTWKTYDGQICHGIVYKPENFDPKKKYPVIVTYYQQNSESLNCWQLPSILQGGLADDAGYLASNGYVVFVADIYYNTPHISLSVYNCVCSGVEALEKQPWVDSAHVGISGISFGGYETLCLASRSGKMFAAALSEVGVSDMTLSYLLDQSTTVSGSYGMRAFPWENPTLYIENSPVYRADKVETPLLMLNNDLNPGATALPQSIEMFIALRQLRKPCWLLDYNQEAHGVYLHLNDEIDYVTRFTQFFDHYLKGRPAPKWMTDGVPARLKGVESGLENGCGKAALVSKTKLH